MCVCVKFHFISLSIVFCPLSFSVAVTVVMNAATLLLQLIYFLRVFEHQRGASDQAFFVNTHTSTNTAHNIVQEIAGDSNK